MSNKKSIFERLGLIEPIEPENAAEAILNEEATKNVMDDKVMVESFEEAGIPELDNVPDLTQVVKLEETEEVEQSFEKAVEHNAIEDKLDVLIGAYEKNKLLTIEEIYRNHRLNDDTKKSIFMADVFMKALPENLPLDIKRESVLNIMNVSSINKDELLNDAYMRIDALNTVLEDTVQTTEDVIQRNEASIRELERRIEDLKNVISDRMKFQEDQNTMIEYEIQKIINIVEFVKPK